MPEGSRVKRQSSSAGGSDESSKFDGSAGVRETKGVATRLTQEPEPDYDSLAENPSPTPNYARKELNKRRKP